MTNIPAIYSSQADAVAATISISITELQTFGFATPGDGGGGTYASTAVLQHGFSSADGRKWEYQTENGYARAAAFGDDIAALAEAWAVSKRVIAGDATYVMTSANVLVATNETVDFVAGSSTFDCSATNARVIDVSNDWLEIQDVSSIVPNTEPLGPVITVEDGTAYAPGDICKIGDDQPTIETSACNQGEFVEIASVSGNELTLVKSLRYTYDVLQSCKLGKLNAETTVNISIGEIVVTGSNSHGNDHPMVTIQAVADPQFNLERMAFVPNTVVNTISCYGGRYEIGEMLRGGGSTTGYGILFSGTEHGIARVRFASNIRHATDSGGSNAAGAMGMSLYGISAYNKTVDSYASGCYEAPFATHHGTFGHIFENCEAIACQGGFGFRGIGNSAVNCITRSCSSGFSAFNEYPGENVATTNNSSFINCRNINGVGGLLGGEDEGGAIYVEGGYYELGAANSSGKIIGTDHGSITFSGGAVINLAGSLTGTPIRLESGCTLFDLGDTTIRLADAPTSLVDVSSTDPIQILTDGLIIDNPNGAITNIFGGAPSLAANTRFGAINVTGGYSQLATGYTVDQLLPFVTGIVRNDSAGTQLAPVVNGTTVHKTVGGGITLARAQTLLVVHKTSPAATAVTLPATSNQDAVYWVVDGLGDANTHNITVSPSSGTINGAASYVINTAFGAAGFRQDSSGLWYVVGAK